MSEKLQAAGGGDFLTHTVDLSLRVSDVSKYHALAMVIL